MSFCEGCDKPRHSGACPNVEFHCKTGLGFFQETVYREPRFRNVIITGEPIIGNDVSIGDYSEVNAKGAKVVIGDGCDIASFVAINAADSSNKCIGRRRACDIKRSDITIGERTFVGSHCFIGGGVTIGKRCKVAAGTIMSSPVSIPDDSLVAGLPEVGVQTTEWWPTYGYTYMGRVWVKVGCYA